MSENPPPVEVTLAKIVDELRTDPEVLRIVDELGIDQVRLNVAKGLARMAERRRLREST